ncbi:hypothetical protein DIPPA_18069 [Diplonema papillatum]|nr:hypothetical protein DIPPA_18069 [Diplonema papillatum]
MSSRSSLLSAVGVALVLTCLLPGSEALYFIQNIFSDSTCQSQVRNTFYNVGSCYENSDRIGSYMPASCDPAKGMMVYFYNECENCGCAHNESVFPLHVCLNATAANDTSHTVWQMNDCW